MTRRPLGTAVSWLITIAIAIGIVLAFEAEVAAPYRIPSASMEPTVHCPRPAPGCRARFADRVIACRICYRLHSPRTGQIVVFRAPKRAADACGEGGDYLKRLIGLPGETVREDEHGYISVGRHRLAEPYVTRAARATDMRFRGHVWHVPTGSYFFLGDNRGDSCDSRTWGAVARDDLIGPVVATYWPPERMHAG